MDMLKFGALWTIPAVFIYIYIHNTNNELGKSSPKVAKRSKNNGIKGFNESKYNFQYKIGCTMYINVYLNKNI